MKKQFWVCHLLVFSTLVSAQDVSPAEKESVTVATESKDPVGSKKTVYGLVDVAAAPHEGMQKFYESYIRSFRLPNISGVEKIRVVLGFIVEADGSLSEIKILRDPGYGVGEEAVKALKLMPRWKPGLLNGEAVRCQFTLPITINIAP